MTAGTLDKPIVTPTPVTNRGTVLIATVNRAAGDTGVHTHTRSLVAGLKQSGVRVRVVTPFDAGKQWLPIFAIRPLVLRRINPTWGTLWYRRWHLAALKQSLRRTMLDPDVGHVFAQCPLSAKAAVDVRRESHAEKRIAISAICHFNRSEADEYRDKGELKDARAYQAMLDFEARTLGEVDHVAFVSDWAKKLVEGERAIRTRESSVVWNGIADAATTPPAITRSSLQATDTDVLVMNVGTLEPRKNQVGLIELFAQIVKRQPNALLILVGDGPDRPAIEAVAARHNIADRVRLLGHRVDVAELMRIADVYLHYAKAENCPIVLIEAARAGLPIAALPVGGVPEILAAIGDAITLDADDMSRSLSHLDPWLASREARLISGRRSAQAFHKHFGRDAMVRRYLEIVDAHAEAHAR